MAELGHPLLYCHRHCVVNSWAWATQVNSWRSSHSRHVVRLNRCPRFHKTSGLHLLQQCLTHRLIHIARYRINEMRFLQCSPGNVGNIFAAQCVQLLGNAKLLFQFADTFDEFPASASSVSPPCSRPLTRASSARRSMQAGAEYSST